MQSPRASCRPAVPLGKLDSVQGNRPPRRVLLHGGNYCHSHHQLLMKSLHHRPVQVCCQPRLCLVHDGTFVDAAAAKLVRPGQFNSDIKRRVLEQV